MRKYIIIGVSVVVVLAIIVGIAVSQHNKEMAKDEAFKKRIEHTPILGEKNTTHQIVVYADFNCPYCRAFDLEMMDQLEDEFIHTKKAHIKFVNAGLLGDDSLYKSVVSYSIYQQNSKAYWKFNRRLFEEQPKDKQTDYADKIKGESINQTDVDQIVKNAKQKTEVNELLKDIDLSNKEIKKVQYDVKNSNSQAWKYALKDRETTKQQKIKTVPHVTIDNKMIEDNKNIKEYQKYIK